MNVQQVLFIFFTTAFYLIVIISSAKKPMHLKRNITKAANAYNLSSRYFGNNRTLRKNFTSRYCFLKEKVEIPNLDILRRNLSGKVLKVTALEEYPFTYLEHNNGKILGRGASFKLFDILAKKYNFSYEIVLPKNNYFGSIRGRNASLLELLTTGKADMGIGYIPPMKDYYTRVLYSSQINLATYHIMMVKPRGSVISRGLLAPFSSTVWIAMAVFFLLMGPVIYAAIVFHREFGKDEKIVTLGQIIWFIYGALVRQGHSVNITPINDSTRILFATWWIFVTILTTFYTANLVAFLARSEFPFSISTVEDFVKTNTKLMVKKGGSVEYALMTDQKLITLKQKIDPKAPHFGGSLNDTQNMMDVLLKNNYAIIASYSGAKHLMYDYYMSKRVSAREFNGREHCPFILSKKPIFWGIQSFVYDCKSQLNFLFDNDLRFLLESGITQYLKDSELPNENVCDLAKQKVETQLKVQDLEITFAIVFIGFLVSFAALLFEIYYVKRQTAKNHNDSERWSSPSSRVSVINEILQELLQQRRESESMSM